MKAKWTVRTAVNFIRKCGGTVELIWSKQQGRLVNVHIFPPKKQGLKVWGCIDFLMNHCGGRLFP